MEGCDEGARCQRQRALFDRWNYMFDWMGKVCVQAHGDARPPRGKTRQRRTSPSLPTLTAEKRLAKEKTRRGRALVTAQVAATHGSPIPSSSRVVRNGYSGNSMKPDASAKKTSGRQANPVKAEFICAVAKWLEEANTPLTVSALLPDAANWVTAWATQTVHRGLTQRVPWGCCFRGTQKKARQDNSDSWFRFRRHQAAVFATSRTLARKTPRKHDTHS
jgi:hypothetical protein